MKNKHSKTKNLEIYRYLLNYETSELAYENADSLAAHLNEHQNKIISCIAQARKNYRIYKELIAFGYAENQIPLWFLRPEKKEEPHINPSESVENNPPQNQGLTKTSPIQQYEHTQPRYVMGVRYYDWEELQNTKNRYQTTSFYDWAYERNLRERMLATVEREREEAKLRKWEHELSQARDPFTFIRIALGNQEWRDYYNSLSTQGKNELFDSINQLLHCKNQFDSQLEQQRIFNGVIFPLWFTGRMMGKW
jgi:hypothetical protein